MDDGYSMYSSDLRLGDGGLQRRVIAAETELMVLLGSPLRIQTGVPVNQNDGA